MSVALRGKIGRTAHYSTRGFTMIELSIVLVIVGLLIGGVLVGRDLIKAAQIRAVVSEVEKYKTAVMTFKGEYDCLPGDCANATTFFGTPCGGNSCNSGAVIYNGNGNGIIEGQCGGPSTESWGAWADLSMAHLANPNIVVNSGGVFGGGAQGATSFLDSVPGQNIPTSVLGGSSGWLLIENHSGTPNWWGQTNNLYPMSSNHVFILGNQDTVANNVNYTVCQYAGPWLPILGTNDALSLDRQMDDGQPTTGSVTVFTAIGTTGTAMTGYNPNCVNGSSAYDTSNTNGPQCTMVFGFGL